MREQHDSAPVVHHVNATLEIVMFWQAHAGVP
jgi:hypothetical protein